MVEHIGHNELFLFIGQARKDITNHLLQLIVESIPINDASVLEAMDSRPVIVIDSLDEIGDDTDEKSNNDDAECDEIDEKGDEEIVDEIHEKDETAENAENEFSQREKVETTENLVKAFPWKSRNYSDSELVTLSKVATLLSQNYAMKLETSRKTRVRPLCFGSNPT